MSEVGPRNQSFYNILFNLKQSIDPINKFFPLKFSYLISFIEIGNKFQMFYYNVCGKNEIYKIQKTPEKIFGKLPVL